jgi:hypothetical protein
MTFRSPWVKKMLVLPMIPRSRSDLDDCETEFETGDGEIRRVGPGDVLSVVRLFEPETMMPHAIIRGKNGRPRPPVVTGRWRRS